MTVTLDYSLHECDIKRIDGDRVMLRAVPRFIAQFGIDRPPVLMSKSLFDGDRMLCGRSSTMYKCFLAAFPHQIEIIKDCLVPSRIGDL